MASVADRLVEARARLSAAGLPSEDAALDAEILTRHLLNWDRAALLARSREPEPAGFSAALAALVARRAAREPVAQILGHREFWGLEFEVTRDVLTPRPETELIVEEAVAFGHAVRICRVIDVGTGSGCLAVAIARELPSSLVVATDTSASALEVARRNAHRHGVGDRVEFLLTSLLDGAPDGAELIVSNPPYVPEGDAAGLPPEVVHYEPRQAVFGGPTGLEVIEGLLAQAPRCLAPGGRLVVEFGFGQREAVAALAQAAGWRVVTVREDLQSIPRTIVLTRNPHE